VRARAGAAAHTLFGVGSAEALESSMGPRSSRAKKDRRPETSFVRPEVPEDSGSITSMVLRGRRSLTTVDGGRQGAGRAAGGRRRAGWQLGVVEEAAVGAWMEEVRSLSCPSFAAKKADPFLGQKLNQIDGLSYIVSQLFSILTRPIPGKV